MIIIDLIIGVNLIFALSLLIRQASPIVTEILQDRESQIFLAEKNYQAQLDELNAKIDLIEKSLAELQEVKVAQDRKFPAIIAQRLSLIEAKNAEIISLNQALASDFKNRQETLNQLQHRVALIQNTLRYYKSNPMPATTQEIFSILVLL